jgi:hypothetical protein
VSHISLCDELRGRWKSQGIDNPRCATAGEISAFEVRHGIALPPDVSEYFRLVNGTRRGAGHAEDKDDISFWHLSQVEPHGDDHLFVFADWLIDSVGWGIRLSADRAAPAPVLSVYDGPDPVAESFDEFLQTYLRGDIRALFPTAPRG